MNDNRPILVTGGSGFLGRAIIAYAEARGQSVRALMRHPVNDLGKATIVTANICDRTAVIAAAKGCRAVIHTAALTGLMGRYEDFYNTNVNGTENVIAACRQYDIPLINTSSPSVIFDGQDQCGIDEKAPYPFHYDAHYPETKALAEQLVCAAALDSHIQAISLRPHLIWGPGDTHLVPGIIERAKTLRVIGDGQNRVDTIYIDNAAEAHLLALDALIAKPDLNGSIYFISQDDPIPVWDMVDRILEAANLAPIKGHIPHRIARGLGWIFETAHKVLRQKNEPRLTRFMVDELATSHWFDITRAKEDLGYVPRISIDEGFDHLKTWLSKKSAP